MADIDRETAEKPWLLRHRAGFAPAKYGGEKTKSPLGVTSRGQGGGFCVLIT